MNAHEILSNFPGVEIEHNIIRIPYDDSEWDKLEVFKKEAHLTQETAYEDDGLIKLRFGFIPQTYYAVTLPHQCGEWEITTTATTQQAAIHQVGRMISALKLAQLAITFLGEGSGGESPQP